MRTFTGQKLLIITAFFLLCYISQAHAYGQALVTFKAPEGLEITSESVVRGEARQYVNAVALSLDARVVTAYGALSAAAGGRKILAMVASDSKTTDELIRALENHPDVLSARPNGKAKLMR